VQRARKQRMNMLDSFLENKDDSSAPMLPDFSQDTTAK